MDRRIDPLKGKAGQFEFPVNFDLLQHRRCSADTYVACLDPTDCVNVSVTNYIYILTSCLSKNVITILDLYREVIKTKKMVVRIPNIDILGADGPKKLLAKL